MKRQKMLTFPVFVVLIALTGSGCDLSDIFSVDCAYNPNVRDFDDLVVLASDSTAVFETTQKASAGGIWWIPWNEAYTPATIEHIDEDKNIVDAPYIQMQGSSSLRYPVELVENTFLLPPNNNQSEATWLGIRVPKDIPEDIPETAAFDFPYCRVIDGEAGCFYTEIVASITEDAEPIDFTSAFYDFQVVVQRGISGGCNEPAIIRYDPIFYIHTPNEERIAEDRSGKRKADRILASIWIEKEGVSVDPLHLQEQEGQVHILVQQAPISREDFSNIGSPSTGSFPHVINEKNELYAGDYTAFYIRELAIFRNTQAGDKDGLPVELADLAGSIDLQDFDATQIAPENRASIVVHLTDVDHPENTHQERILVDLSWFGEVL